MKLFKDKIEKKDVGFAEDSFECLKHAVGQESHHLGNLILTENLNHLKKLKQAREIRTDLMNGILKSLNSELIGQEWCLIKHICGCAMVCQELITRSEDENLIKIYLKQHKKLFLMYLDILGINEKNAKVKSSA